MKVSIHAGHGNPDGKAQGAVGYVNESRYARQIVESIKAYWNDAVAFNDATVNTSVMTQREILAELVNRINAYAPDVAVSIHMNSFSDVKTEGLEVIIHPNTTAKNKALAEFIVNDLSLAFGFKNRGVKENSSLYILNKTKYPTMIIEVGFVTSYHDSKIVVEQYDEIGARIAHILSGQTTPKKLYDVKVYGVNEDDAKKITDIAYKADVVYQKKER